MNLGLESNVDPPYHVCFSPFPAPIRIAELWIDTYNSTFPFDSILLCSGRHHTFIQTHVPWQSSCIYLISDQPPNATVWIIPYLVYDKL